MIFQEWFIKNGNTVIRWFTISILSVAFIFLLIMSIIKKDLQYPRKHPIIFTLETILISLTMGVISILMSYGRKYNFSINTLYEFFLTILKIGIFHILLQFSGFYTYSLN